jgi:hypothetical protein
MKPNFTPLWRTGVNDDNKMIADFIGFKPCLTTDPSGNKIYAGTETPFGWNYPDCYPEADYLISVEDLKFNTSWDWLMLVIQECHSRDLDPGTYYIPSFDKYILPSIVGPSISKIYVGWDINEVYKALVDFIYQYYIGNWEQLNN